MKWLLFIILLLACFHGYSQKRTGLTSSVELYSNAINQLHEYLSKNKKIDTLLIENINVTQDVDLTNGYGKFIDKDFVFKPKKTYSIYVLRPFDLNDGKLQIFFTYYSVSKKGKMKNYKKNSDYKIMYEYDCQNRYWHFATIEEIGF